MTTGRINQVTIPGLRATEVAPHGGQDRLPREHGPRSPRTRPIGPSCKASDTLHQPSGCRGLRRPVAGLSNSVDRLGRPDASHSHLAHQQNGATHSPALRHGAVDRLLRSSLPPMRLPCNPGPAERAGQCQRHNTHCTWHPAQKLSRTTSISNLSTLLG